MPTCFTKGWRACYVLLIAFDHAGYGSCPFTRAAQRLRGFSILGPHQPLSQWLRADVLSMVVGGVREAFVFPSGGRNVLASAIEENGSVLIKLPVVNQRDFFPLV